MVMLMPRVEDDRRRSYMDAVVKHVHAIEQVTLAQRSGAFGVGRDSEGQKALPFRDEYTIASTLCGGAVFS
jgi:hypothetical protein